MQPFLVLALLPAIVAASAVDAAPDPDVWIPRHGVASRTLQRIMENISGNLHDTGNVDEQVSTISPVDLERMVEAVEELLFYAEVMLANPPRRDLGEHQLATFRALANQLHADALAVRDIAGDYTLATYDFGLLNAAYGRMYDTCAACHELFRDP